MSEKTKLKAELITVGAELLKGSTLNTNAQFVGRQLLDLGFNLHTQISCHDDETQIVECLRQAWERSNLIILSGGLGPTPDDITREAVARFFNVALSFSSRQYAQIKKAYRKYGHGRLPSSVKKEAQYPENAVPIINKYGIALGFYIRQNQRMLVALPGVPAELEKLFEDCVCGLIRKQFPKLRRGYGVFCRVTGLSEPVVMEKLGKDFFRQKFEFGIYPMSGEIALRIYTPERNLALKLKAALKRRLGAHAFSYEDKDLAEEVGCLLASRHRTVAVAESCSGGLLASEITRIPGASRYFRGSVVAYDNKVKKRLGVNPKIIQKKGAVSEEVAGELASSIREFMNATYGIGITGIAGPGAQGSRKPAGLVYIALATPRKVQVFKHLFWGDRRQVQMRSAKKALQYLWQELK